MVTHTEVQEQIANNLADIEKSEALERLLVNTDFVLLFTNYYSNAYALDIVYKLSTLQRDGVEYKALTDELNAISYFKNFLDKLLITGAMARTSLDEVQAIPQSEIYYD